MSKLNTLFDISCYTGASSHVPKEYVVVPKVICVAMRVGKTVSQNVFIGSTKLSHVTMLRRMHDAVTVLTVSSAMRSAKSDSDVATNARQDVVNLVP
jgi:hypothetical protein